MFIRRFFYDLNTGEQLRSYMAEGKKLKNISSEEEARKNGLVNYGVFEWTERDSEVEAAFSNMDVDGNLRIVHPYIEDGELKFEYTYIEQGDDLAKVIDVLTGEVN